MCTVCGCGEPDASHHSHEHSHPHDGPAQDLAESGIHQTSAQHHGHPHDHGHHHDHNHHHHYGCGDAGVSVAGFSQARLVQIEQDILSKNSGYADANRRRLAERGLLALNLVSSPGSGKTTLLVETIEMLRKDDVAVGVLEGDQATSNDAERIQGTGVPAIQINTGKGCHLDAHMVGHALHDLHVESGGVVFIENVGNLVCPAAFDLGEAYKVVILSVTEGEDKPLKYPDMFSAADVLIVSKLDLLPHVDFDVDRAVEFALRMNPHLEVLQTSARNGVGLRSWCKWIASRIPTSDSVEMTRHA